MLGKGVGRPGLTIPASNDLWRAREEGWSGVVTQSTAAQRAPQHLPNRLCCPATPHLPW